MVTSGWEASETFVKIEQFALISQKAEAAVGVRELVALDSETRKLTAQVELIYNDVLYMVQNWADLNADQKRRLQIVAEENLEQMGPNLASRAERQAFEGVVARLLYRLTGARRISERIAKIRHMLFEVSDAILSRLEAEHPGYKAMIGERLAEAVSGDWADEQLLSESGIKDLVEAIVQD